MWGLQHTKLQKVCIYLWPVPADCRLLVAEAGVDSSRMTFAEPPALFWESVILQCEKQESLRMLVPVLLARYPKNKMLQEAVKPWIDLAEDAPMPETIQKQEMIVAETPTTVTTMSQVKKIPGGDVDAEHVPVMVPKEFAEDASVFLVATVNSLKVTVDQLYKDVNELIAWREAISILSRAEVAARTGGNEPGADSEDDAVREGEKGIAAAGKEKDA